MKKKLAFIASLETYAITDFQLFKDVCLVPNLLGKRLDYDVVFVLYAINETLLHEHFPETAFHCISDTGDYIKDMTQYLMHNAMSIDMIFTFGAYYSYLPIIEAYKSFNPNGKVYMKLDLNRFWLSRLVQEPYFPKLLSLCDLVTSECRFISIMLHNLLNFDIKIIPNGYYEPIPTEPVAFEHKKNIILTVGRLGTPEKQTDILIKAFEHANLENWELRLVGPIDNYFIPTLVSLVSSTPLKITCVGPINDKQLLDEEYRQAKIFCLTSSVECYAHVFAEAAKNGCYIVSTDVDGAQDITRYGEYGKIHTVGDWEEIGNTFKKLDEDELFLPAASKKIQTFARAHLNWDLIIKQLVNYLNENKML